MNKQPAIYLLTNKTNGTLYTGVTSDLPKRVWQHKNGVSKGFCTKYNLTKLVEFVGGSEGATELDCRGISLAEQTDRRNHLDIV